ncbi:MAG TPA: Ig-like domain-containing protein [Nevskiaceae bacterium]|nr:Ig-like domain-containing protein [Nevskiaceae bacterium]
MRKFVSSLSTRFAAVAATAMLAALPFMPVAMATAAGTNLIPNPSVETASGSAPASWAQGGWGTNTSAYTWATTGQNGSRSLSINTTKYTNGDAKWMTAPVTLKPSTKYQFSDYYISNVQTSLEMAYTSKTGKVTYGWLGTAAISAAWKQASFTFTTPADVASASFYHVLAKKGTLQTDSYDLQDLTTGTPTPTAPTVNITAPTNGSTVSGTQAVTATATDAVGVSGVQFKVDGTNLGAEDTTAPYTASLDTTTLTNAGHTISAVARNAAALTATSTVNVTVNNVAAPAAPTVSITAPANNATVSGTQNITTTTSNAVGVQFKVDNVNFGAEDTSAPFSTSLDTTTLTNGTHTVSAVARNSAAATATSTVTINVNNVAAPTVAITAPANNATVSGTQSLTATATNAVGVQFKVDGTNIGAEDTTAPYSASIDTKTLTNGSHTFSAVARNAANTTATSTVTVTVNNPTPPTVSITAPANGSTVSGTLDVTANASDAVSVAGVQFKLDGANLGAEDTTAPYSTSWNTTTATNGSHTLSAVARNGSGLTTLTSVTVTVNNVVTPPSSNLIANPSVETSANGTSPDGWISDSWGNNTSVFSYLTTGHTGNRSLKAEITTYTDGAANWDFAAANVTAGKTYKYSNWYQSNVDTEIDAAVTMNDGTVQYFWIGGVPASATWAQATGTFVAPAGAKSVTFFQVLAKKGYVISDDFSLTEYTPAGFTRGLVSITFDDAWRNQYTNGLPVLNKYGLKATFYQLTQPTLDAYPDYMTVAQMQTLKNGGHQIAAHTVDHENLTTLTVPQIDAELANNQSQLRAWFGTPGVADDFATPYGAYNSTVITEIKKYYRSHRSTDVGFNSKDSFDIYNIKVQNITNTTTPAQVAAWVDQAYNDHTWLVLVYHEVATNAEDPTYAVTPANLDAELAYIKNKGISVQTVAQALAEIQPQL